MDTMAAATEIAKTPCLLLVIATLLLRWDAH
jgi:hypothetical protein